MPLARLSYDSPEVLCLVTPYVPSLVRAIKTLPYGCRQWDPARKVWLIAVAYREELRTILAGEGFQVQGRASQEALAPAPEGAVLWSPPGMPLELAQAFYTLGLNGSAPLELAEHVWRWWLRLWHPDVSGTQDDTEAKRLNDAIATIRTYLKEDTTL